MFVVFFDSLMAFIVCDTISRHSGRVTCPKWLIILAKNWNLFILSVMPALGRKISTVRARSMCFCRNFEKPTMSSKDTRELLSHCGEYDFYCTLKVPLTLRNPSSLRISQ